MSSASKETHDICRQSDLTPGEVNAAYLELNGQIIALRDSFVGKVGEARREFEESLLPLLDAMHSLLSQRGKFRKLLNLTGAPTWQEWFQEFEELLQLDISLRQVQRWLKTYRNLDGDPVEKDINVLAKESVRHVESPRQAEKLESVVKERKQLNPAIRSELVRALKAKAKTYLALAAKLEKAGAR